MRRGRRGRGPGARRGGDGLHDGRPRQCRRTLCTNNGRRKDKEGLGEVMVLPRKAGYVSFDEASDVFAVSKATLSYWAKDGRLKFHSNNGYMVLDRVDVEEMAAKLNPAGPPSIGDPEPEVEKVVPIRPAADSPREAVKLPPLPQLGEFEDKA